MKKLFSILLAVLVFASAALPAGALIDKAVFTMSVDTENWDVIIFNVNEAEYAERHAITYSSVHSFLAKTNTYIDAAHISGNREITVKKTAVNTNMAGSFENLVELTKAEKNTIAERAAEAFEPEGGICEFAEIYRHPQTDFMKYRMTYKMGKPDEYHGLRYYTVVNGINVYIDYYNYAGEVSAEEEEEMTAIIDSINFTGVEVRSDENSTALIIIIASAVGVVVLAALAVFIIVKITKKGRKRTEKPEETGFRRSEDFGEESAEE